VRYDPYTGLSATKVYILLEFYAVSLVNPLALEFSFKF
jgi:hypothetical protein